MHRLFPFFPSVLRADSVVPECIMPVRPPCLVLCHYVGAHRCSVADKLRLDGLERLVVLSFIDSPERYMLDCACRDLD